MKKFLMAILAFFPALVLADSLSFAPPAGDYSVIFLGNIFGIVDGVLHGNGSQIMGSMFSVFNAAVLALGGIVIMYTLLVSTMNTAHEGQMLGQKWSSIWIPVRSTAGMALLIPKASGYCLMQIFVMWVVVQGVGAADKVWNAALSYLNRGGAIIQAQTTNPATALLQSGASTDLPLGATRMLAGAVCMSGLQTQLQNALQSYKTNTPSPCEGASSPNAAMTAFCNSSIPDFIGSVDFVQQQTTTVPNQKGVYTMPLPNFPQSDLVYSPLNGICGTIAWNPIDAGSMRTMNAALNSDSLKNTDMQTIQNSRALALQQMFGDLATMARTIVNNSPALVPPTGASTNNSSAPFSPAARLPFGLPLDAAGGGVGQVCSSSTDVNCLMWGMPGGGEGLFNGTEFSGAISDYNGVMLPTLTLEQEGSDASAAQNSRQFIAAATQQGWIMAGSYFFNLVTLNVQAQNVNGGALVDTSSGLENSVGFQPQGSSSAVPATIGLLDSFQDPNPNTASLCTGTGGSLCMYLNGQGALAFAVEQMINGAGLGSAGPLSEPNFSQALTAVTGPNDINSATVYGLANNAMMVQIPGQPGMNKLSFANAVSMPIDTSIYTLPYAAMPCGELDLGLVSPCVGRMFGDLFYNLIFRYMYNTFLTLFGQLINQTIMMFLMIPMVGMASIFKQGLIIIDTPGVNPIVALANMGTYYINFAGNLWLQLIEESIVAVLIPIFGIFIFSLISMSMPLLLAWMGIMLQIGFVTAYYVPILPYSIFVFGAIAWLTAVIEAMVAAPIVALGVTHPEGHDAFGKGEQAIMILMNVFLRPAMMIMGYIAAIIMSYVSVWVINAGFDNAIGFVQGGSSYGTAPTGGGPSSAGFWGKSGGWVNGSCSYCSSAAWAWGKGGNPMLTQGGGSVSGGYTGWAGLFAYFFSILVYTMMYLTVVQKSFMLIAMLPDKVLRWIGGQPETAGSDAAQWGQEIQSKVSDAGDKTGAAQAQIGKQLGGEGMGKASKKGGEGKGGGLSASEGGAE